MKTLAQLDAILGDPYQAPRGFESQPREHFDHVMLFYEFGLIDLLIENSRQEPQEEVAAAVINRIHTSGWLFRMEPQEFFQNYLENWFIARFEQRAKEASERNRHLDS